MFPRRTGVGPSNKINNAARPKSVDFFRRVATHREHSALEVVAVGDADSIEYVATPPLLWS